MQTLFLQCLIILSFLFGVLATEKDMERASLSEDGVYNSWFVKDLNIKELGECDEH